jgi:hypothetical protein
MEKQQYVQPEVVKHEMLRDITATVSGVIIKPRED